MPRFSLRQYQPRVLIAMAIYTAYMLFIWPHVRTATSLPSKALLALAPTLPVLYVIGQMARLIRSADELERHTHLVALSTATAVVSALSFIGGFLAAAGVVKLDGSVLLLVFPAMVFGYGLVRWRVMRGYDSDGEVCGEENGIRPYLYLVLFGVLVLVVVLLFPGRAEEHRVAFGCGMGGVLIGWGLLLIALHQYRRKQHK